jgi:hypothetical protein
MSSLGDLWGFMKERKKWWLLPVIIVLMLFAAVLAISSISALAPFVYTVF